MRAFGLTSRPRAAQLLLRKRKAQPGMGSKSTRDFFRRPLLELLEDRRLLACTSLVGSTETLLLCGAAPQVTVGYSEDAPLVSINNAQVTPNVGEASFSIAALTEGETASISLSTLTANPAIWTTDSSTPVVFTVDSLTSSTGHAFANPGAAFELFEIANAFAASDLSLIAAADGEQPSIQLQGTLDFGATGLEDLVYSVDGDHRVEVQAGAVDVTGGPLSTTDGFRIVGVDVDGMVSADYQDNDKFQ